MTLPLTPRPNRLQESVATNESTSTQIFGMMYITLTGLIDSMVPVSGPWAVLGKSLSYIVKLIPILWWALPAGPAGRQPPSSQEPPLVGSLKNPDTIFFLPQGPSLLIFLVQVELDGFLGISQVAQRLSSAFFWWVSFPLDVILGFLIVSLVAVYVFNFIFLSAACLDGWGGCLNPLVGEQISIFFEQQGTVKHIMNLPGGW
ncbi:hypothetical protein DSO57_1031644 [Entomophthora muscae]|uniref:Uncharacterized protein n=2 Tax=Entomophthora muscae TaxID=34485 RepID=A0ACC2S2N4_9FUNG|nr:hypothetical protein DSO57_1031643 [Entomophthora muscae]KAJ9056570.1 hypothetical protein DSO57_1031644 [Entomophthora muscae]